MDTLRVALWAFPGAYALHVAEEAPGFVDWARRHASSSYSRADFVRVNGSGFAATLLTTWLASRGPRGFALHHAAITQQAVWNPAFHAAFRAPGLPSAAGAVLPAWIVVTVAGLRRRRLTRRRVAWSIALGAPAHAAAVWSTVYRA